MEITSEHGVPTTHVAAPGDLFGRYRIEEFLGAGGMGEVYRARDLQLDRPVAIKLLTKPIKGAPAWGQLLHEARIASSLNHPNICTVYETGEEEGYGYISMEYVEGRTLNSMVCPTGLSTSITARYGAQIAQALDYAHQRHVVHRDVNSRNIAITSEDRVKLLDFGLAQHLRPEDVSQITSSRSSLAELGSIAGTLPYLAPEILHGAAATPRSDLWSLGVVLHEMSTGQMPFTGQTPFELSMAIMGGSKVVLPRRVPKRIRSVVAHCLERDPARRYESAQKVAADLQNCESPRGPTPAQYRLFMFGGLLAALALLMVALMRVPLRHSQQAENVVSPTPRTSIAVLALRNSIGKPDVAWLSTALSEMLTSELGAGTRLRAISGENVARLKMDFRIGDSDSLAPDTLAKIHSNLGSDYLILGSYTDLGGDSGGKIRLDLRLQDARKGIIVTAFAENGRESELFDLVSRAGTRLRQEIGAGAVPERQAAGVKAEIPSNPEIAKLYADGLAKLWAFDAIGARPLLANAVAEDPQFPLAHSALGVALSALGYEGKAREEAKSAFDLSANLNREAQLVIEGRYRIVSSDKGGMADAITNIALVLAHQGSLAASRSKYQEAAGIARGLGTKSQLAQALEGSGDVARERGQLDEAARLYGEALSIRRELGEKGAVAESQILAWLALEQGNPAQAQALLNPSIEELRSEAEPDLQAFAEAALARALLSQGRQHDAEAAAARARRLSEKAQSRAVWLTVAIIGARVEAATNEPARLAEAIQSLRAVETEAGRLGFVDRQLEARLALAEIDLKRNGPQSARGRLSELEKQAEQLGFGLIARKVQRLNQPI